MRIAFKMQLTGNVAAEYQRRHSEIWPELVECLKEAGISDYAIFLDRDANVLFAVQTVDGGVGAADLGDQAIVQKWWSHMADLMETNPDKSPVVTSLDEVFYLP